MMFTKDMHLSISITLQLPQSTSLIQTMMALELPSSLKKVSHILKCADIQHDKGIEAGSWDSIHVVTVSIE